MSKWRNNLPKSKMAPILVLFAFLISLISQSHLHIDNESMHDHASFEEASHSHSHSIDVHTPYDISHSVTHPDVQVVSMQPEAWVKYMNDDLTDLPAISLLILFILMLPTLRRISTFSYQRNKNRLQRYFNFPALRAPPAACL